MSTARSSSSVVASRPARGAGARPAQEPRAPRKPQRPQRRVVRSSRPKPSRRVVGILGTLAVLLVFGSLLALAVLHTLLVQNQLRLDRLGAEIEAEQDRAVELRLEVARLAAPERILAEAARLGMVVPDARGWLVPVEPGDPDAPLPPPGPDPFGNDSASSATVEGPPAPEGT